MLYLNLHFHNKTYVNVNKLYKHFPIDDFKLHTVNYFIFNITLTDTYFYLATNMVYFKYLITLLITWKSIYLPIIKLWAKRRVCWFYNGVFLKFVHAISGKRFARIFNIVVSGSKLGVYGTFRKSTSMNILHIFCFHKYISLNSMYQRTWINYYLFHALIPFYSTIG